MINRGEKLQKPEAISPINNEEQMDKDRKNLFAGIKKNEDAFENKITYISAGCIVLSMGFLASKESLVYLWLFYIGVGLQTASLFFNLSLYLWANWMARKEIQKIDAASEKGKVRKSGLHIKRISDRINKRNLASLVLLGVGIAAIMIFVFLNTNKMKDNERPHSTSVGEDVTINNSFTFEYERPHREQSNTNDQEDSSSDDDD